MVAGTIEFQNNSNAGTAHITNDGGNTSFRDTSSAQGATITNVNFGATDFNGSARAGNATIINNADGATGFFDASTADNATITTNNNGFVFFFDNSTGGNARFITNAGGEVDFSGSLGPNGDGRITAGSIEGAGSYFIGAGNTLVVGGNNLSTEVSGIIADACGCSPGPGTLEKVGTGTLTLSGLNTYSGGTVFTGGTVSVSQEANLGDLTGGLTFNGGILQITGNTFNSTARTITWGAPGGGFDIADPAHVFTVSQDLLGGGALTKLGPGTLVLSGNNTYVGGTIINAGALAISSDANLGAAGGGLTFNGGTLRLLNNVITDRPVTLNAGAVDTNGHDGTLGGQIIGPGSLTKFGLGTLTLTGNNTYSGGTVIAAGTLQIGDGGATGSISGNVLNNGVLAVNRIGVATFDGVISGTGAFHQLAGTSVMTGNNTYTGGTAIGTGGGLQLGNGGTTGSIVGNVVDNGILSFNRSDTVTFDGQISGTGQVIHIGGGTTVLTLNHSYIGSTSVAGGTLLVNGSIASSDFAVVNPGATIGGTGVLPRTTIDGGTLAPGNSIGTITIAGNLTFVGPGTYLVEVSPTDADRTNVTGTASLGVPCACCPASAPRHQPPICPANAAGGVSDVRHDRFHQRLRRRLVRRSPDGK